MSAFLGKIHFWLYKKIRLVIAREQLVLENATATLDDLAEELHETAISTYGAPLDENIALEDVIDHGNIHGWLNNQIEVSTVREASFIKDLVDCGGDEGIKAVLNAFAEQGFACGMVARDELPELSPEMIYNVMQNYYLNGMPCDGGDTIVKSDENTHAWEGTHANQKVNWTKAGVDQKLMTKAYQEWFRGFVTAISESAYEFTVSNDTTPIYTIIKK